MLEGLAALGSDPTAWIALATLVAMEVVLGIDNLIFISVLTNKLPDHQRENARRIGIGLALGMRLLLLASIAWIVQLTAPVFTVFGQDLSWRDIMKLAAAVPSWDGTALDDLAFREWLADLYVDAEAIRLANDTDFGLAATVVSGDPERAGAIAERIDAGHIWINTPQVILPETLWGGFRASGIGRELGPSGLEAYRQKKFITTRTAATA